MNQNEDEEPDEDNFLGFSHASQEAKVYGKSKKGSGSKSAADKYVLNVFATFASKLHIYKSFSG